MSYEYCSPLPYTAPSTGPLTKSTAAMLPPIAASTFCHLSASGVDTPNAANAPRPPNSGAYCAAPNEVSPGPLPESDMLTRSSP
eukprot:7361030-Prymnesium_polylepis.1